MIEQIKRINVYIFSPKFREICPEYGRGALPLKLSLWSRVSCRVSLVTLKQITIWYRSLFLSFWPIINCIIFSKVLYNSGRFIEKANAFMHLVSLDRVKRKKFYMYLIYKRFIPLNVKTHCFSRCTYFFLNLEKFVQNMAGVPSLSNSPSGLAYHAGFH